MTCECVSGRDKVFSIKGIVACLSHEFGISRQAVNLWRGSRVPAERVLDVERITQVPRHEIRPDIYPAPSTITNSIPQT